jgi:cytochrome c2
MAIGGNQRLLALLPLAAAAAACKPAPEQRQFMPLGDPDRGRLVIERVGCASCHTIPGIAWPKGKAAMPLSGFAHRAMIAGRVPNEPELLARFVRNAPSVLPGTTMPAMPVSEGESRDVAAYLYEISGD